MKIEILYFEGCPNHEAAERAVREILDETGVTAEIVLVDVPDQATAERVRFPGSPTIRVDGEDVAPNGTAGEYSLRCRVYKTISGLGGGPEKDMIRNVILRKRS